MCIWLLRALSGLAYLYGLYFAVFDVDSIDRSDIADSLLSFVRVNACDSWTVSRILS